MVVGGNFNCHDADIRTEAMMEGALQFFAKPFDHQLLLKLLRVVLNV
jgi:hypothetical protein